MQWRTSSRYNSSEGRQTRSDTGSRIRCKCSSRSVVRVQARLGNRSSMQGQRGQAEAEVRRQARVGAGGVQGMVKTSPVSNWKKMQVLDETALEKSTGLV